MERTLPSVAFDVAFDFARRFVSGHALRHTEAHPIAEEQPLHPEFEITRSLMVTWTAAETAAMATVFGKGSHHFNGSDDTNLTQLETAATTMFFERIIGSGAHPAFKYAITGAYAAWAFVIGH